MYLWSGKVSDYKPVKVLQLTGNLGLNGLTSVAMNYYRNIGEGIQFDFAIFKGKSTELEDEIIMKGGKVFKLNNDTKKNTTIFSMLRMAIRLYKLLKSENYQALHSHAIYINGLASFVAWLAKVPVRVVHSHNDNPGENGNTITRRLARIIERSTINLFATNKLACSKKAATFLYGESCFNDYRVVVINNAVDLKKFNPINRKKNNQREIINFVFIGRYETQKNPLFLIKVFGELHKIKTNIRLNLIGSGILEKDMKELVNILEINEYVKFIKPNTQIEKHLSHMDYFLLPSLYEGLPVVLVEAQAMSIPCFVSDTVTEETDLGLCKFLGLKNGERIWAEEINRAIENNWFNENADAEKIKLYDIKQITQIVKRIYLNK
jgi:glycosyltransferase involved in cell wall biosynthesis